MKLNCVLTAVNENPLYLDFIPIFIKTWNKLYPGVDIKIILISYEIPKKLLSFNESIILFKPIKNILTSFTSQFIRLLYPCILNYENGVLITDIDMLPMNNKYYTDNINEFPNNKFIYFRDNILFKDKQIAMCYNIATPNIWKEIFEINSLEDIQNKLKDISKKNIIREGSGNEGWFLDQMFLYKYVMEWNIKTNNLVCLNENNTGFKRLDRIYKINNNSIQNIKNGLYSDFHCYRPMSQYHKLNYYIISLLK